MKVKDGNKKKVKMTNFVIAYYLEYYRLKSGYSLRALSKATGISKTQLHRAEKGEIHPNLSIICNIAYVLKISPYDLFEILKMKNN